MHLLTVNQGELSTGMDTDACAIRRRSVEFGRVPSAAPRAGHHAFVSSHRGSSRCFRLLLPQRCPSRACDSSQSRDQQGKCTGNSCADHDDLDPETVNAHGNAMPLMCCAPARNYSCVAPLGVLLQIVCQKVYALWSWELVPLCTELLPHRNERFTRPEPTP